MVTLKIIGAVAALCLGVWLGLPGRYERRLDEIDQQMEIGGRRHKTVKRAFTPVAWLQRQVNVRAGGAKRRRGFNLERPEDR